MVTKRLPTKTCIVCRKEYPCYKKGRTGSGGARILPRRASTTITCSHKCSVVYHDLPLSQKTITKEAVYGKTKKEDRQ